MARLPRLSIPGLPHQVIYRGNNGQPVFLDDADRQRMLECLAQYAPEHRVDLHAYVLMPGEVVLLLTPQAAGALSGFMQAVGRKYTRQFNQRHGRSGTLWEGRYRSTVLQPERFLLACMVCIDQRPVQQALAPAPQDYAWSSHAHYIGRDADRLVVPHAQYWQLGNTPFAREAAYAQCVEAGVSAADQAFILQSTRHGWVMGDPDFLSELQGGVMRRLSKAKAGRPARVPQGRQSSDPN